MIKKHIIKLQGAKKETFEFLCDSCRNKMTEKLYGKYFLQQEQGSSTFKIILCSNCFYDVVAFLKNSCKKGACNAKFSHF